MNKKLTPARVPIPGRIVKRELEARGWTQKDLAEIIGRPVQTINEIVGGSKQITPQTALELSQAFGTSPEFWTNLETNYRLHLAKKNGFEQDIARKSRLYDIAPISELIKKQWIHKTESIDGLEKEVCNFFGISSLDEIPQQSVNFRCAENRDPVAISRMAWVKRVENLVKDQNIIDFDRKKLEDAIPDILAYAQEAEHIAKIPDLLADVGVHFTIVKHLSKTYLDGATFELNGKPVIALTLRYDRIDSFWFTLMHELAHIVLGHQGGYLDDLESLEDNDEEKEANQKAADWLIEPSALNHFISGARKSLSRKAIEEFAQTQCRHPGIILGRLHHDGLVPHQNLRSLFVKVSPFLENWTDI